MEADNKKGTHLSSAGRGLTHPPSFSLPGHAPDADLDGKCHEGLPEGTGRFRASRRVEHRTESERSEGENGRGKGSLKGSMDMYHECTFNFYEHS